MQLPCTVRVRAWSSRQSSEPAAHLAVACHLLLSSECVTVSMAACSEFGGAPGIRPRPRWQMGQGTILRVRKNIMVTTSAIASMPLYLHPDRIERELREPGIAPGGRLSAEQLFPFDQ